MTSITHGSTLVSNLSFSPTLPSFGPSRHKLNHIQGIPFAKTSRFEHSYLYNESDSLGVVNATSYGPICPQKTTGSILTLNSSYSIVLGADGTAIGPAVGEVVDSIYNSLGADRSEDCLSINVQTPQNITADAKLPVLIWM